MGHMAKIEDGIVVTVLASRDDDDDAELELSERTGDMYRRTSYNTRGGIHYDPETGEPSADQSKSFRFNYAGIGYTFDPDFGSDGAFVPPQPFPSWLLDETTALWVPPVPYPDAETCPCGAMWDEDDLAWICVDCPE